MELAPLLSPMSNLPRRSMIAGALDSRVNCRQSVIAGALLCGILFICTVEEVRAQTTTQRLLMQSKKYVSFTGSAGFTGEAYATTGRGRRPPMSARSFMQATVNVMGIKTGLNLQYSTEQNRIRQSLNKIGFESTWRWVKVGIGDTYPRFSEYSLNGLQLQGVAVDLSPGIFRFGFATGRTQRATEVEVTDASPTNPLLGGSYRRNVTAVRIGVGDVTGNHFQLIGMKARDDTLSIRTAAASPPAENLSLTTLTGFSLFNRRFNLAIDGTVSVHNRDLFSREIDTDNLLDPDSTDLPTAAVPVARLITRFFTPTVSTRVGYAVQARTSIRLKTMNLRAQYKRIGPGFTSLGVFTVRNDLEQWRVMPTLRFMKGRASIAFNYGQSRNNLTDRRASSRRRDQVGVNVRTQWTQGFSVGSSFQQGTSEILPEITNPAIGRKQVTQRFTLNPTLILKRGSRTHTFSLSTTLQRFQDRRSDSGTDSQPQATSDFRNLSASLSWFASVTDGLNFNATLNMLQIQSTSNTSVLGLITGASGNLLDRKLNVGVSLGATRTTRSSGLTTLSSDGSLFQLTANLTTSYRITKADQIRLSVRGLRSQNSNSGSPSFSEIRSQFNYSHRF